MKHTSPLACRHPTLRAWFLCASPTSLTRGETRYRTANGHSRVATSRIRAPGELSNIRVSDLRTRDDGILELHVREEVSKTFGRRIKLLLCSSLLKEWIASQKLSGDDFLIDFSPSCANRYLRTLAGRLFGDGATLGRKPWNRLTMYDFRHSSSCYWISRYKTDGGLMYRFGWKSHRQIHYYTELLGMRDPITEADLLDADTTTNLEAELEKQKQQNAQLAEELAQLRTAGNPAPESAAVCKPFDDLMDRFLRDHQDQIEAWLRRQDTTAIRSTPKAPSEQKAL